MIALLGKVFDDLLGWLIVFVTFGYWGYRSYFKSDDRRMLVVKWICSVILILSFFFIAWLHSVILSLLYVIPAVLLAFLWLPSIGGFLLKPLTSAWEGGGAEGEMKPFYFIAEAKRRKGLYDEAVAAVREQLETFPGDFEGMMKLATIQAEDLKDLPAASETINDLLQQPGLPVNRTVAALHALADWQMNLGRDPAAARTTFERIIQMYPGTPLAHNAEQRIAHLDGVTQARDFRENAVFKVPVRERDLGLRKNPVEMAPAEIEPDALAAEYVAQLEKYPNDTETREKLALLYAEQLGRLDLAVNQLEQLAALPYETPKHIAHWLGLLATLHIRQGNDMPAAENALRRIVDRFPKNAVAMQAMSRLATLQGELKAAASVTAAKTLGTYEKDLGLKSGPYGPR